MDTKETTIYQAVLIAAVVIGGIIFFLVLSLIRLHRRHLLMYRTKVQAEITAMETERSRIAADLHDELGPLLSAVKFKISGVRTLGKEEEKLLAQSQEHIDNIILKMRTISNDLVPNILLRKGLISAVESFVDFINTGFNIKVKFIPGQLPQLAQPSAIHLYRVIQEIVHNTLKHARADKLVIRLYCMEDTIIILTRDDGIGFDYDKAAAAGKGLGLHNLESRTDMLKGTCNINTRPGKGTQIYIRIPLIHHYQQ
jgi:signal transduction histidine kinase